MNLNPSAPAARGSALPWMLLALLLVGLGVVLFRTPLSRVLNLSTAESAPGLSTSGVLTSIRDLSNLESVAMNYQVLVRETREGNPYLLGLDKQRALIVADGTVTAGVNLERLGASDVRVSEDGTTVQITLPPAELLAVNVTKLYTEDVDTGMFGLLPADPTLHDTALGNAQLKMRTLACTSDILQLAGDSAERTVERLFMLIEGVQVTVVSRPASTCAVGATP